MLTGKDYPYLCEDCRAAITAMAEVLTDFGPDGDDEEAAAMAVYDQGLYCGGHICINKADNPLE